MKSNFRSGLLSLSILFLILSGCSQALSTPTPQIELTFDAGRAYQDVLNQMAFGPRVPDSPAHQMEIDYITSELKKAGWQVEIQDTMYEGHPVKNITAKRSEATNPILLAAHYDCRMVADQDKNDSLRLEPVPGANDGASGVAVLLEIARVLPADETNVWLVFFDSEDQGEIEGWDWILGSQAYADNLTVTPTALVLIDMIGDTDLNIYREKSSTTELKDEIWQTAAELGYLSQFINTEKFYMIDDHTPFLKKGIPAVDLIDFDYPYWHTSEDTADKLSPQSLEIVGNVLLSWLASRE